MTAKNEGVKGLRPGWVGELLRSSFLPLMHPSAWKGSSQKFVCDISYNLVTMGEKRSL